MTEELPAPRSGRAAAGASAWRRRSVVGAVVVLLALPIGAALLVSAGDGPGGAAIAAGNRERAPELVGEWLVPPPLRLAELRGQLVVVNFWASWCVPCAEEAPELARFDREERERARLVGVAVHDGESDARRFVRRFRWRFPNVHDPRGELASAYGMVGLPTTVVIDCEGRIARVLTGAQAYETLVAAVEEEG